MAETLTLEILSDELKTTFEDYKKVNEKREKEIKANGEALGETKTQLETLNSRLDQFETRMKRLRESGNPDAVKEEKAQARKNFAQYLRKGDGMESGLTADERKTLIVSDDTTGGFLAPSEMATEIDKDIVEFSPIRSIARISQISRRSLIIPRRVGTFTAEWEAEGATQTETEGLKYGKQEVHAHALRALVKVSLENLEDPVFDIEAELRLEFAEQFGVAEGVAFVGGNGITRPEGFLTVTPNGVNERETAGSLAIDADDLIDLMMVDIKSVYWPNGVFGMNRTILAEVRKLKDGQGQYLWAPGVNGSTQSTFLGRGIIEMTDMDSSVSPLVAAEQIIVFADFRRFYWIVDRIGMSILRDPFTLADQGLVRFIARKRVGGQVVRAEAGSILKVKA